MLRTELLQTLTQRPLGLIFDIDGTLSPIAPTPGEARLYPGVAPLLERLRSLARVAIMTGRAIVDGAAIVNVDEIIYIGNHGMEWSDGLPPHHPVTLAPEARELITPAAQLLDLVERDLTAELPGIYIQRKAIGGSVHYRQSTEPEVARSRILDLLERPAQEAGLNLSNAKMVVDVQVPGLNKGVALRRFCEREQLHGVCFAGDDRTDLDAIRELAQLRVAGLLTCSVAVRSTDILPALLEEADLVVDGVPGMFRLLQEIVTALEGQAPSLSVSSNGE